MVGAGNSGDRPEAGTGWELGIINLKVHFFPFGESSLFCIEWWGGPGGEFKLQAVLNPVTFLQGQ